MTFWYTQYERLANVDLAPRPGVKFADDLAPSPLETTPEGTPVMPEKKPSSWIHKLEVISASGTDVPTKYRATFCLPTRQEPLPSVTAFVDFWMPGSVKYPLPPLPVPVHTGSGPAPKVLDRRIIICAQFEGNSHLHIWVVEASTGEWFSYDPTQTPLPVTTAGQDFFKKQRRFNPFQWLKNCLNMKKQLEVSDNTKATSTGLAYGKYFCDVFPPNRPVGSTLAGV